MTSVQDGHLAAAGTGRSAVTPATLRISLAVIAAFCLLAVATASASAASSIRSVARSAFSPALGDGGRWVAFASTQDTVRILDEREGIRWSARIPCATSRFGSPLLAVGGGVALVACEDPPALDPRPLLLDLATRTWREVAGVAELRSRYSGLAHVTFDAVGSRWLHAVVSDYKVWFETWIDWRTGTEGPPPTPTSVTDLGSAALQLELCAPLRRRQQPKGDSPQGPQLEPATLERPYALVGGDATPLTLQHCGSHKRVKLAGTGSTAQLSGGVVSWSRTVTALGGNARSHVGLYLPRCSVRRSWPGQAEALHTNRWLYRGTPLFGGRWAIERLRLPRC